MIAHDAALDLAADRLDFTLDDDEAAQLESHLAECDSCRHMADVMRLDDDIMERGVDWGDEQYFGDNDEFSPTLERSDGDDEDADDDIDVGRPERDDPDDTDADPDAGVSGDPRALSGDDDDEDEDLAPNDPDGDDDGPSHDAEEQAAREIASADQDADEDESDEDDSGPARRSEDGHDDKDLERPEDESDDDAESEPTGGVGLNDLGLTGEDDDEAEAYAAGMSDSELGDVESDSDDDQYVPPACAADGVDDAAQENGASVGEYERRNAEAAVRAQEGTESTDYGKVAVYKSVRGLKPRGRFRHYRGTENPEVSAAAAAAIRNAILRSRTGNTGIDRRTPRGRLDSQSVHRIAMRDGRLFKRVNAPAPGNFLVWIMVDCSSSMAGREIADAASVARALADASTGTPTVRMAVWGWSNPFLDSHYGYGANAGVARVWQSGDPTSEIFKLLDLRMGGTPDAAVLDWARNAIVRECRSNEKPVIIMASDGFGDYRLPLVVEKATKKGVVVKSVALGYAINEAKQEATFGRGNYVAWKGQILDTARPLATMIGRMAAGL